MLVGWGHNDVGVRMTKDFVLENLPYLRDIQVGKSRKVRNPRTDGHAVDDLD